MELYCNQKFQNPEDTFPTIYRIDRLKSIEVLDGHFVVPYAERFEEGEFRKRVQFMYGGRLRKIKLKCQKHSLEAVLDKLPTGRIIKKENDFYIVQAEVFGDGIEITGSGVHIIFVRRYWKRLRKVKF